VSDTTPAEILRLTGLRLAQQVKDLFIWQLTNFCRHPTCLLLTPISDKIRLSQCRHAFAVMLGIFCVKPITDALALQYSTVKYSLGNPQNPVTPDRLQAGRHRVGGGCSSDLATCLAQTRARVVCQPATLRLFGYYVRPHGVIPSRRTMVALARLSISALVIFSQTI